MIKWRGPDSLGLVCLLAISLGGQLASRVLLQLGIALIEYANDVLPAAQAGDTRREDFRHVAD